LERNPRIHDNNIEFSQVTFKYLLFLIIPVILVGVDRIGI